MKSLKLAVFLTFIAVTAGAQTLVTTDWLQAHRRDRNLAVVEIGDRATYEAQHIAGARFVALNDIVIARDGTPNELPEITVLESTFAAAGIGNRDRIVLYAREPIPAARAFFTLDYLGHGSQVSLLDGGWAKWIAEDRAVEKGPAPAVQKSDFEARTRAETIVRLHAMKLLVECLPSCTKEWAIVDARPVESYIDGHITGAMSVPRSDNLTGGSTPVFRSRDELATLYRGSGVPQSAAVVVYCRTGMQASVDYFILRYLGHEVSLYDGSYVEWTAAAANSAVATPAIAGPGATLK